MAVQNTRFRPAIGAVRGLLCRLMHEEAGQDIVEYAFLAAFIGVTSYLALNGIVTAVGVTYSSWIDPDIGVPSRWEPPLPSGG